MENIDVAGVYDKIAKQYDEAFGDILPDVDSLDSFLSLVSGKKILDVGCGTGRVTKYFHGKGFDVVGVDLSQGMLDIAKNNCPGVYFRLEDMSKIDFMQNSFDGIVFSYSLFHASKQDVPKILAKTNLMLNDDGVVYLVMQEGEGEVVLDEPFLPSEKIYFNLYTEEEIVSILGAAGFEVVSKERIAPGKEEIPYSKLVLIAKKMGRENEEAKT